MRQFKPFIFKNDFLPNQLGKVFWDYYVKYYQNQVREFQNEKHGSNYEVLSEVDFVSKHGEKPWDLVNRILVSFDSMKYLSLIHI